MPLVMPLAMTVTGPMTATRNGARSLRSTGPGVISGGQLAQGCVAVDAGLASVVLPAQDRMGGRAHAGLCAGQPVHRSGGTRACSIAQPGIAHSESCCSPPPTNRRRVPGPSCSQPCNSSCPSSSAMPVVSPGTRARKCTIVSRRTLGLSDEQLHEHADPCRHSGAAVQPLRGRSVCRP
jgi:hypothetical protein